MAKSYANPDVLVSTRWVDEHRSDTDNIRIVESDEDVLLYDSGHIPEAVKIDWINDLNDPVVRDYIDAERFAEMCGRKGIDRDTTVVFYGDKSNWWACYAFWVFKLLGHDNTLIMNGGRQRWQRDGRELVRDKPTYPPRLYTPGAGHPEVRAFREDVLAHMQAGRPLVDVRSTQEFSGERTHIPEYPQEGVLRGGHIPGALNCPWSRAVNEDGTFKTREALEEIYLNELNLRSDDPTVAYCRIGERSSHTWFVLTYLLGFERVRNYDGSWTEWGNMVRMPVENPSAATAVTT